MANEIYFYNRLCRKICTSCHCYKCKHQKECNDRADYVNCTCLQIRIPMGVSGITDNRNNQSAMRKGIQGQCCNGSTTGQNFQIYMIRVGCNITNKVFNDYRHSKTNTTGARSGNTGKTTYGNSRCDNRVAECTYQKSTQGCI